MPTAPRFMRSDISTILRLIKAQIVLKTGFQPSRVRITARDGNEVPHDCGDQDVLLRVMGEREEAGWLEGGGRATDGRTRTVEVICRSRCHSDAVDSDEVRLTDPALGLIPLEDRVKDALQILQVQDSNQNMLTFPLYLAAPTAPETDRNDPNWVHSAMTLDVPYVQALTQSWQ